VSDESIPKNDEPKTESGLQRISNHRHYGQRYNGPDGDYVFRKAVNLRGPDGKSRRVARGERVDRARDGLSLRRIKALWYAQVIELFDPKKVGRQTKPTKGVTNNRAIREEEARITAAETAELEERRNLRRELNARQREEAQQRKLAEQAILAAEDSERRELAEMIREEENLKLQAQIDERLAKRAERAVEKADSDREKAAEVAQVQAEKAALSKERSEQAAADDAEKLAEREAATLARLEAKEAERQKRVGERVEPVPESNPKNRSISTGEAEQELEDRKAAAEVRGER